MSGGRSDGPAGVNDTGHVTNNAKRSRRVAPKDGGGHPLGFPDAVWRRGVRCFLSLVSVASNLFRFVGKAWGGGGDSQSRARPRSSGYVPAKCRLSHFSARVPGSRNQCGHVGGETGRGAGWRLGWRVGPTADTSSRD